MSLDKAIIHKKEHRKPYKGSKAICRSCRNHGSCPWCETNRKYRYKKIEKKLDDLEQEWYNTKERR